MAKNTKQACLEALSALMRNHKKYQQKLNMLVAKNNALQEKLIGRKVFLKETLKWVLSDKSLSPAMHQETHLQLVKLLKSSHLKTTTMIKQHRDLSAMPVKKIKRSLYNLKDQLTIDQDNHFMSLENQYHLWEILDNELFDDVLHKHFDFRTHTLQKRGEQEITSLQKIVQKRELLLKSLDQAFSLLTEIQKKHTTKPKLSSKTPNKPFRLK